MDKFSAIFAGTFHVTFYLCKYSNNISKIQSTSNLLPETTHDIEDPSILLDYILDHYKCPQIDEYHQ